MDTLYTNINGGEILCLRHGGGYLRFAVQDAPRARRWDTPFGTWRRWTAADDAEWQKAYNAPAECESCACDRRRAQMAL